MFPSLDCNSPFSCRSRFFPFQLCLVSLRSRAPLLGREIKLLKLHPKAAREPPGGKSARWPAAVPSSLRWQARAGCLASFSFFPFSPPFGAMGPTRLRFRYLALACVIFLGHTAPAHRLLSISSRARINTSSFIPAFGPLTFAR